MRTLREIAIGFPTASPCKARCLSSRLAAVLAIQVGILVALAVQAQDYTSPHDMWVLEMEGASWDKGNPIFTTVGERVFVLRRDLDVCGVYEMAPDGSQTLFHSVSNCRNGQMAGNSEYLFLSFATDQEPPTYVTRALALDGTVAWEINPADDRYFRAADAERIYSWQNSRVFVYSAHNGDLVDEWGDSGTLPGQLSSILSIATSRETVFVLDYFWMAGNTYGRIQFFRPNGEFVLEWPKVDYTIYGGGAVFAIDDTIFIANRAYDWTGVLVATLPDKDHVKGASPTRRYSVFQSIENNATTYRVRRWHRVSRVHGGPTASAELPQVVLKSVGQRPNLTIMDVTYRISDVDSGTVDAYAGGFVDGKYNLSSFVPVRTLVEGTDANLGAGIAANADHLFSWQIDADWSADFASMKMGILAKDDRDILGLHFLDIPADIPSGGLPMLRINRIPVTQADLFPLWLWMLAKGDARIRLSAGEIYGVGGACDGVLLAHDVGAVPETTEEGRQFLFEELGVREATSAEVQRAKEATTPGSVSQWNPRIRFSNGTPVKVNEFNFDTGATAGWWVVPVE